MERDPGREGRGKGQALQAGQMLLPLGPAIRSFTSALVTHQVLAPLRQLKILRSHRGPVFLPTRAALRIPQPHYYPLSFISGRYYPALLPPSAVAGSALALDEAV